MELQPRSFIGNTASAISLRELITRLVHNSWLVAQHNKSSIVNEVTDEVVLGGNIEKINAVLGSLLSTVVANSKDGEIHITADKYRDVIILEIEERNNYNGYALAYSVGSIQPEAASLGGHITIKDARQKTAVISFSFPFAPMAA